MHLFAKQLLCVVLICQLVCPPAMAAGISVDSKAPAAHQAGLAAANNGVPVVNIVKPNSGGISHNKFHDFNVGKQGVIINNSTSFGVTQLGGVLGHNPNFTNGRNATVILNEVTSSNRSLLQGYTEVFGGGHYILANPNGVTIDGGGFIGTPRATITTGVPTVNGSNVLLGVTGGDVLIQGAGVNTTNISAFEIVSRTATINADIHADSLKIVAGKNTYNATTGAVSEVAPDGSALPAVVIDSSALGGMYAGRISLIGTEKGVGVNLEGITQATDHLTLTAEGKIALKNTVASGNTLAVTSTQSDIAVSGSVAAVDAAALSARGNVDISGQAASDNRLDITSSAGAVTISGTASAGNDLTASATQGTMDISGTVSAAGAASLSARDDMTVSGEVTSGTAVDVTSTQGSVSVSGTVSTSGTASLSAQHTLLIAKQAPSDAALVRGATVNIGGGMLDNRNLVIADNHLAVNSANVTNSGTLYSAGTGAFNVSGALHNDRGTILSKGDMLFEGSTAGERMTLLQNDSALIESLDGSLTFHVDHLVNTNTDFQLIEGDQYVSYREGAYWKNGSKRIRYIPRLFEIYTGRGPRGALANNVVRIDNMGPFIAAGFSASRNLISREELRIAVAEIDKKLLEDPDYLTETQKNNFAIAKSWSNSGYAYFARKVGRVDGVVWAETKTRDTVVNEDKGATIAAHNNITITGEHVENNVSAIIAGTGDITVTATTFENVGREVYERRKIEWGRAILHNHQSPHIVPTGGGTEHVKTAIDHVYGTVAAGNNVVINSVTTTNGDTTRDSVVAPPVSASQALPDVPAIPTGTMFVANEDPAHPFLIETRKEFVDLSAFVGGEYLLNELDASEKEITEKLIGDAYYTTRLVRGQIMDKTGRRFLQNGGTSDAEQVQQLMDNALAERKSLGLSLGVELSKEQIAALDEDIVWLVEAEVQGQTVLVPKLYLGKGSLTRIAQGGAVIAAGNDVVLAASESVQNAGAIVADNKVTVTAENIFNTQGSIAGKDVELTAADSIHNVSGAISGENVALAATKNIVSTAAVVTFTDAESTAERIVSGSQINASKSLTIAAGENVALSATKVTAGEDAILTAGKDVTIATVETVATTKTSGSKYRSQSSAKGHTASAVQAGKNLTINAGENIIISGSDVKAGETATLHAEKNVSITSAESTETYSQHYKGKGKGAFGSKKSGSHVGSSSLQTAAQVRSDGTVAIDAGAIGSGTGDLAVVGSRIASAGDVSLQAEGGIIVASAQETQTARNKQSSKGLLKSEASDSRQRTLNQIGSEITSGGTVSAKAKNDLTVSASNIYGKEGVELTSEQGNVKVIAAQNEASSSRKEKTSGIGVFFSNNRVDFIKQKESLNSADESANIGSSIASDSDVTITAHNDVAVVGSDLATAENITVTAGRDVNIVSGRNEKKTKKYKKEGGVGIGFSFSEDEVSVSAGYKGVEKGENFSGAYNATSTLSAGENITITAGQNVTQISSDMQAGNDVSVTAGNDINVTAAHDVEELDSYVKEIEAGVKLAAKQSVTGAARTLAKLPQNLTAGKGSTGAKAVTAASAAIEAYSQASSALSSSVSVSLTAGASYTESRNKSESKTAVASGIHAGNDVTLKAGDDLTIDGGLVSAEKDVTFDAGGNVAITSAQDTYSSSSSTIHADASAGVGASAGAGGASGGASASASVSGSDGKTDIVTHANAEVKAGETLTVTSGKDTTIEGAHLQGKEVVMNVGENLTVKSVQDTLDANSSRFNAGASVNIGAGTSVNVSGGGGKGTAESRWVNGQTSIIGEEKVNIYTGKNTHVEGAVIAALNDNLTLNTETLTFADIKDTDKGEDVDVNVSASVGFGENEEGESETNASGVLSGGYSSHDKRQINRATIGKGTIILRSDPDAGLEGLNRDLSRAQEITKDSETVVKVFIDTAAIKDIANGGEELASDFEKVGDQLKKLALEYRVITAALPPEVKHLGASGLEAMQNMIRQGADESAIIAMMSDVGFQELISQAADLQAALNNSDLNGLVSSQSSSRDSEGNLVVTVRAKETLREKVLSTLKTAQNYFEAIPYKEEAQLALIGVQTLLTGPVKTSLSLLGDFFVDSVVGETIEKAKTAVATELASQLRFEKPSTVVVPALEEFESDFGFSEDINAAEFGLNILIGSTTAITGGKAALGNKDVGSSSRLKLTYDKATKTWTSPAGLRYGKHEIDGNRILHVLKHAEKNTSKPKHSVFNVSKDKILGLVDEAWQKKSDNGTLNNGRLVFDVDMGRVIGTKGQKKIRIVVESNKKDVVTAFPIGED